MFCNICKKALEIVRLAGRLGARHTDLDEKTPNGACTVFGVFWDKDVRPATAGRLLKAQAFNNRLFRSSFPFFVFIPTPELDRIMYWMQCDEYWYCCGKC